MLMLPIEMKQQQKKHPESESERETVQKESRTHRNKIHVISLYCAL